MRTSKILITANVLFSKPHIQGTRVSVEQVLACIGEGWSNKKIMNEFDVSEKDIKACMLFALKSVGRTHFVESTHKAYA